MARRRGRRTTSPPRSPIRRVLARVPGGDRWIRALARRGYRFIGPSPSFRTAGRKVARRSGRSRTCPSRSRRSSAANASFGRDQAAPLRHAPADARRCRGHRQDAPRSAGRRRGHIRLPRRRLARGQTPVVDSKLVPSAVTECSARARWSANRPSGTVQRVKGLLLLFDNCDICAKPARSSRRRCFLRDRAHDPRDEPRAAPGDGRADYPFASLPARARRGRRDRRAVGSDQLFLERAQAATRLRADRGRVGVITQLCIRLDGIPLALG